MNAIFDNHTREGCFGHGYLLVGPQETWEEAVYKAAGILLNRGKDSLDSHPDFFRRFFDSFGINESVFLRHQAFLKPIVGEKRVFFISVRSFTFEATNALLKLLEEPPKACHFFINVLFIENISPVLRSRLIVLSGDKNYELERDRFNFYENFLKMEAGDRLLAIKNIAFDKKEALKFLLELEIVLGEKLEESKNKDLVSSLDEIVSVRQFLFDRAPSPKIILEHFALTLPKF